MEDRSYAATKVISGFRQAPKRTTKEVWEIGVVEAAPPGVRAESGFTNVGTAFRTDGDRIMLTLKPGISVSGTIELRKK